MISPRDENRGDLRSVPRKQVTDCCACISAVFSILYYLYLLKIVYRDDVIYFDIMLHSVIVKVARLVTIKHSILILYNYITLNV